MQELVTCPIHERQFDLCEGCIDCRIHDLKLYIKKSVAEVMSRAWSMSKSEIANLLAKIEICNNELEGLLRIKHHDSD